MINYKIPMLERAERSAICNAKWLRRTRRIGCLMQLLDDLFRGAASPVSDILPALGQSANTRPRAASGSSHRRHRTGMVNLFGGSCGAWAQDSSRAICSSVSQQRVLMPSPPKEPESHHAFHINRS